MASGGHMEDDQCSVDVYHMEDDSMLLLDEIMDDSPSPDFMMPMETSCGAMNDDFFSVEASSASRSQYNVL